MESDGHLPELGRVAGGYNELERKSTGMRRCRARWRRGADRLLAAFQLSDDIGQLAYRVWYFASLRYDEDQRDNTINARRQQVQILFANGSRRSVVQPGAAADPARRRCGSGWTTTPELAVYRFAIEDLYRQQEHVLDEKGEQLLSLSSRFSSSPNDAYAALSTADVKHFRRSRCRTASRSR